MDMPILQVTYRVEADDDGGVILECQHVDEGRLHPEEVSAQILTSLLQQAEDHLQASITKAVISVSQACTPATAGSSKLSAQAMLHAHLCYCIASSAEACLHTLCSVLCTVDTASQAVALTVTL